MSDPHPESTHMDFGLCTFVDCPATAVVRVQHMGLCLEHLDWGLGRALLPAHDLLRALTGMPARPRVERYLYDAAILLRAAGARAWALDPDYAASCAAVALQAEDLLQRAADRLDHARAAQQGGRS